jgi:hypothetical protein
VEPPIERGMFEDTTNRPEKMSSADNTQSSDWIILFSALAFWMNGRFLFAPASNEIRFAPVNAKTNHICRQNILPAIADNNGVSACSCQKWMAHDL